MAMARAVSMGPLPRLAGRTAEAVEPAGAELAGADAARRRLDGRLGGRIGSGVFSVMTRLYSVLVRSNESSGNKCLENRVVVGQADFTIAAPLSS